MNTWEEQGSTCAKNISAENLRRSLSLSHVLSIVLSSSPHFSSAPPPSLCSSFAFALPHTDSFSTSMSCLPPCLLASFTTVQQTKFPNVEVIFDIGKPEVGQQPVPWLISTLWPKCAISKPHVPDLQEQLRPVSLQRFDYLR